MGKATKISKNIFWAIVKKIVKFIGDFARVLLTMGWYTFLFKCL